MTSNTRKMSTAMALESGLTRIVADQVALARATTNTQKMTAAMKKMWDTRSKLKAAADSDGAAFEMVLRAQIDEVFLVLAHLGEAIIPLGIFNKVRTGGQRGSPSPDSAKCVVRNAPRHARFVCGF